MTIHCAVCDGACTCDEPAMGILFVSPQRFKASPQVGTHVTMSWREFGMYLSRPSIGEEKAEAGAYSPAVYEGNVRRKASLVRIWALIVDIDENGDVDNVADALSRYSAIVHETFSSTNDAPRCRIVLELAEDINAATYETAHKIIRSRLRSAGIVADEGAKDASRLSYAPCRREGAGYRFRANEGEQLDACALIAAQPPPPPRPPVRVVAPEHRDVYVRGALRKAAEAVSGASEGERHYMLCKEAFALARLGLSDSEIESALLPAFVAAAGERRQHEGIRTIRDATRARVGGVK